MKIKGENLFFLIVSIVGFMAFFMPWLGVSFLGNHSGYDIFIYAREMELNNTWTWVLIFLPISFLICTLYRMGVNINWNLVLIFEFIPMILIIYLLVYLLKLMYLLELYGINLGEMKSATELLFGQVELFFGINVGEMKSIIEIKTGVFLTLIASMLIVFSSENNPKKQSQKKEKK